MARMEKTQLLRPVIAGVALMSLTACMGGGNASMATVMGQTAAFSAAVQPGQVLASDIGKSCSDLNQTAANLYARAEQIEQQSRAQDRQNALFSGLANAAIGIVGSRGMFGAGSIQGIEAAQTATQLAQNATSAALTDDSGQLEQVTSVSAIAQRVRQVEAAKVQKGC